MPRAQHRAAESTDSCQRCAGCQATRKIRLGDGHLVYMTAVAESPVLLCGTDHDWSLRDVDFEDGGEVRRFECVSCGAVRFD